MPQLRVTPPQLNTPIARVITIAIKAGAGIVLSAPLRPADLLRRVFIASPELNRASRLENGEFVFDNSNIRLWWTLVGTATGAAIVIAPIAELAGNLSARSYRIDVFDPLRAQHGDGFVFDSPYLGEVEHQETVDALDSAFVIDVAQALRSSL